MTKTNGEAMTARLDVLSLALQEIARALAPAQAAQVAAAIRTRMTDLTATPITPVADEALTRELAPLLKALGSPAQVTAIGPTCFKKFGPRLPTMPNRPGSPG